MNRIYRYLAGRADLVRPNGELPVRYMGEECSTSQFRPWPASFRRAVISANKQSDSPETILTGEDGIDDFDNLWLYCAGWPGLTLISKWCSGNKF